VVREVFSENQDENKLRGEVAPTVFASDIAQERLYSAATDCRIVVLVRDPVERALSHYRHERALGLVRGSLAEAVRSDPRILEASRYSKYLPKWKESFGISRVLCLHQDRIRVSPHEVLNEVCRFLEIDGTFQFEDVESRPSRATGVRFPLVARILYRTASGLRGAHFNRMVNIAGKTGIRHFLQGNKEVPVSTEDREFAEERLAEERNYTPRHQVFGKHTPPCLRMAPLSRAGRVFEGE